MGNMDHIGLRLEAFRLGVLTVAKLNPSSLFHSNFRSVGLHSIVNKLDM